MLIHVIAVDDCDLKRTVHVDLQTVSNAAVLHAEISRKLDRKYGYWGFWVIDREVCDLMLAVHLTLHGKITIDKLYDCFLEGVDVEELEDLLFF